MSQLRPSASESSSATEAVSGETTDARVVPTTALPGPRGFPILESTVSFARDPLAFLESAREYGDLARYEAFGREFVVVSDPGLVEQVLVSRSDEFWRGTFEDEFGDQVGLEGVFFATGDQWRRQRLLLQQAFTPARIDSYADDMVSETVRTIEHWDDGAVVDVNAAFSALTLRALSRSLFDLSLDDARAEHVRRWVEAMASVIETDMFGVRAVLPSWVPSRSEREYQRAKTAVDSLVRDLLEDRRDGDGDDLFSLLATAEYPDGSRPSAGEITDQLLTFLLAGHETTATALTYACWFLAGDDAARDSLAAEVEAVCGDRDPRLEDLPELAVTEAIGREALRLYPPLPFLHREPHEPTALGGVWLTPETTVQLNMYGIHRDDRWWADPEAFRPGRWLEDGDDRPTLEDDTDRPEYAYFPFGGGPRHCIGMRFAMTELQLTLATLARRVDVERVTTSLEPSLAVSLDPGPVEMRVQR
ncbi:cytochrome P450 [Natrarchaeobaculum aegyptiacum]|uniref:Cytochrome P450 n=1 Tax=Natrarchaeobaculum aegyptiacum TaxID=745377 RepID=A0A2Z2HRF8_9EURY|nr:cytochrome P450 [Natrarchaeobaculum aegyptiacum]ARS89751.1 cytochrome P450 [Natrarchaeobaculum aegyptiacum]